jgi:DNA polymerase epsilon subunit 1
MPLKFPDAKFDNIMQISLCVDGDVFLINNRQIFSKDVEDFEYTPKPEYESFCVVLNESDEISVLRRFFALVVKTRPNIFVTFNGDFFDWPFIEARCKINGLCLEREIGIY